MSVSILRRSEEFGYRSPPLVFSHSSSSTSSSLQATRTSDNTQRATFASYCGPSIPPYLDISREYCFWKCESLIGMYSLEEWWKLIEFCARLWECRDKCSQEWRIYNGLVLQTWTTCFASIRELRRRNGFEGRK